MKIQAYPLGELQANCYFLAIDKDCLIIDAGDSADFILEKVQRENFKVRAVIATHGHFDHLMAAGEVQVSLDIPFYLGEEDLFLLKRVQETAQHFLGARPAILQPKEVTNLKEGDIEIGPFSFEVVATPGHTPGSRCLYFKDEQTIFTGDTLFKEGIGRYDFSYSDKRLLKDSLERLFKLPEETLVYSGHGDVTTLGEEEKRRII